MNPAGIAASRAAEVRDAAREWRAAGLIDDAALAAVRQAHPDDRVRMGLVWRLLVFFLTMFGVGALAGGLLYSWFTVLEPEETVASLLLLAVGVVLLAVTGFLVDRLRFVGTGVEWATSLLAAGFTIGGTFLLMDAWHLAGYATTDRLLYLVAAAVFLAMGIRWGFWIYTIGAVAFLFVFLASLPDARLWLFLAGGALAQGLGTVDDRKMHPAARLALEGTVAVAFVALYLAVNLFSLDHYLLEGLHRLPMFAPEPPDRVLRLLSMLATALVPAWALLRGFVTRRRVLLDVGILLAACSFVTMRFYVHLAPLWTILTASGVAVILLAILAGRFLDRRPDAEWRGFTARPLGNDERRAALLALATAAAMSPAARELSAEPDLDGRGGTFGGGGASQGF